MVRLWQTALVAALVVLAAGCGEREEPGTPPPIVDDRSERPQHPLQQDRVPRLPVGDGRGGVELESIGDFEQPVHVAQPPSGDRALFVVEQEGRVVRVPPSGSPETFLDLSDRVSCCGEQGLLSVAFAPDYARSGRLYVDYTDENGDTRVVEYRREPGDPGAADAGSARELLFVDQPYANHNGGLVIFGPDRHLYVGLGDGGSAGDPQRNGQDLSTPLGKILRIDPGPRRGSPYAVPASNPFVERDGAAPEIYAYGLRNPWRFSFDRADGSLWIGDVGQSSLEEVDVVAASEAAGANFGWSAYEGTQRFNEDERAPGAIEPVLTYGRERGCSITGGHVVRDPGLPSLYGRYLYGDYCAGELRSFTARKGEPATDDRALGLEVPGLSSFGEDARGRLYATSLEGPVFRLAAAETG